MKTSTENRAKLINPIDAITKIILPTAEKYGKTNWLYFSAIVRSIAEITDHNMQVLTFQNPTTGVASEKKSQVTGMGPFRASKKS